MLTIVFVLLCIIAIALFHSCKYLGNIHYIFKIYFKIYFLSEILSEILYPFTKIFSFLPPPSS